MKRKNVICLFVLILFFCNMSLSAFAAGLGVCTHVGHGYSIPDTLNNVKSVGSQWMRDGIYWKDIEKQKGVYSVPENFSAVDVAQEKGVHLLFILSYGNPIYSGGSAAIIPLKEDAEYFNGYINYVKFVATTFKGKVAAYEVWNEPNISLFNVNNATGAQYKDLLEAAYQAIKGIDPDVPVLGGSITAGGANFLDAIFAAGGGEYMDAVSIHAYANSRTSPEDGNAYRNIFDATETVLDKYGYPDIPVWLTENGWYTGTAQSAKTEEQQAAYTIRNAVLWEDYLADNGRQGNIFWYDLRNDGTTESNSEHNFGLVDYYYARKPAFYAVRTYNRLVADKEFSSLTTLSGCYRAEYSGANGDKAFILWSIAEGGGSVEIPLSGDVAYVYHDSGTLLETIENPSGSKIISVGEDPIFVECEYNETKISDITYAKEKSVVTVSGTSNYLDRVTITLLKDGLLCGSATASVTDGVYQHSLSVPGAGTYVVYAGKVEAEQLGNGIYATRSVTAEPNKTPISTISEGTIVSYDSQTGRVNVAGMAAGYTEGETVTVLAVPSAVDLLALEPQNVAYIGETIIQDGEFSTSFFMPAGSEGTYQVLLRSTNAQTVFHTEFVSGAASPYTVVCGFSAEEEANKVTATAKLCNPSAEGKTAMIFLAQYDSAGQLIAVRTQTASVPANTVLAQTIPLADEKAADAVACRAYVLENMNTLIPLTPKVELK